MRTRNALILILITALLSSTFAYVLAQTPTGTLWITPGPYPGTASYTIWRDGANYFAKDEYGELAYSGTNASGVIQSAIDAANSAATRGGEVFIEQGTYLLAYHITFAKRVTIRGEGMNATILRGTNASNYVLFGSYSSGDPGRFMGLENIQIAYGRGIRLVWCLNYYFQNVLIFNSSTIGFSMEYNYGNRFTNLVINRCTTVGLAMDFCNNNNFFGLVVTACGTHGVEIKRSVDNHFLGIDSESNGGYGFYSAGSRRTEVSGWFENNTQSFGPGGYIEVYLWNVTGWGATLDFHIHDCNIDTAGKTGSIGIQLKTANGTVIGHSVKIWNATTVDILVESTSYHTTIYAPSNANDSYLTDNGVCTKVLGAGFQNSGSASGATGFTVNHQLMGTPDVVTITPTTDAGDFYVSAVTSMNFTIAFDGGGSVTFYWYAEYKP